MTAAPEDETWALNRQTKRRGLGYEVGFVREKVVITFGPLSGNGNKSAMVKVECYLPPHDAQEFLTYERLTLTDGNRRANLAKRMDERVELPAPCENWRNLIDGACADVLWKDAEGAPVEKIGRRPRPIGGRFVIETLIERHQVSSFYGDGKVGKSWLVLACLLSVRTGVEIIPGFKPLERGPVLYLDWETDADTMSERVEMVCRGVGIEPVEIDYLHCDRPLVDLVERIMALVQEDGHILVAVDSVEYAMAGSRAEYADQNEAVLKLHAALRMLGTTVVVVDHISAQLGGQRHDGLAGKAYGSIFKRNAARAMFEVKQSQESVKGDVFRHLGIYNTARNNGRELDPIGLKWELNSERCAWQTEDIDAPDLVRGLKVWEQVKAWLEANGKASLATLVRELKLPKSTISSALLRNIEVFEKDDNDLFSVRKPPNAYDAYADAHGPEDDRDVPF